MATIEVYKIKKDGNLYKNPELTYKFDNIDEGIKLIQVIQDYCKDSTDSLAYKIGDGVVLDLSNNDFILECIEIALGLKKASEVNPPEQDLDAMQAEAKKNEESNINATLEEKSEEGEPKAVEEISEEEYNQYFTEFMASVDTEVLLKELVSRGAMVKKEPVKIPSVSELLNQLKVHGAIVHEVKPAQKLRQNHSNLGVLIEVNAKRPAKVVIIG